MENCIPDIYECTLCGNMIEMINPSGRSIVCCGRDMKRLHPGTSDGDLEKHVPVYEIHDHTVVVHVGSKPHPMTKEHYIQWVWLVTDQGVCRKLLKAGCEPTVTFAICDNERVKAIYALCNIHGLWMVDVPDCN